MKKPSIADRILDFFAENPGKHKTADIVKAIGGGNRTSSVLGELAKNGDIQKIKNGTYASNDTISPSVSQQTLRKNINKLREAEANNETIDILMNIYDIMLLAYQSWVLKNISEPGKEIDFEKRLLFLENFKWLTAIGDRLMKRWSLEHVGYDTNTRQAQEDAKAKTAEREKAALKDAPLEDKVHIVGHFHTDLKQLWDDMPASEREKQKV